MNYQPARYIRMIACLAIAMHCANTAQAQRIHGFVSGGLTLSQIEGDELKSFSKWGVTTGVGAIAGLDRHSTWNLSAEALYTQRGSWNGSGNPYSISLRLDYVDIPFMVHYRDPWGGMLVGLGVSYSRLLQQPHDIIRFDREYFYPDTNDMQFLKNDLAVVADIRFTIWRGLMLNIRWQYSLIAVKRDWHFFEHRGSEPERDSDGNPVTDPNGTIHMVPRWVSWANNCYNNSLSFRLIWQF